eukprot:501095_1
MANSLMQQLDEKQQTIVNEWNNICKGNNYEQIITFFEEQKQNILSYGTAWFFENLIKNDDIKSVKSILQQLSPKYINLKPYPVMCACMYSTFEMVRLIVTNGATIPAENKKLEKGLICNLMLENKKMTIDEIYLCIEYLLKNLTGKIECINIIKVLTCDDVPFDSIKIANIIKNSKYHDDFKDTLHDFYYMICAAGKHNFEFAEHMIDHGAKLDRANVLFAKKWFNPNPNIVMIEWLLKHNVNINEYLDSYWLNGNDEVTK